MRAKLMRLTLIGALLCATGAQWVLLQSVAWAKMAAGRLGSQGVRQAIAATFDGRHPCHLCLSVQKGSQSQKKLEGGISQLRFHLIFAQGVPGLAPLDVQTAFPISSFRAESFSRAIAVPPPRSLRA